MVSSYARFLGLNPEELTRQFLREYHEYENHEARQNSSPYGTLGTGILGTGTPNYDNPSSTKRHQNSEHNRSSRSMWDRPIPNSDLGRGYAGSRPSATRQGMNSPAERTYRARESAGGSSYYNNSYTAPRPSLPMRILDPLLKSPVLLTIILVIILVGLLVLWALAANSCKNKENEVIPINTGTVVTGGTNGDSTGTTTDPGTEETDPRYLPFELLVRPVTGEAPWVEVTVDGEVVFAGFIEREEVWTVNERCMVMTGQPRNLVVTRNGEKVTLEENTSTGTGEVTMRVEKRPASQQQSGTTP
jgi:hypothetical protein